MKPKTGADVRALLQNRTAERPRAEIPTVQLNSTTATIRLYDAIDSWGEWWGMSAKEFAAALDDLPSNIDTIELLINSPGGEVYEAMAIINQARAHPARIVAVVQGIAASAASLIACAADETIMAPNSTLMIHKAWGLCIGNADEHLVHAAKLEKNDADQAQIYTAKSGKPVDEIAEMMSAETFLSASEAVDAGFADRVATTSSSSDESASARLLADAQSLSAAIHAELEKLGVPIPSAGEREDHTSATAQVAGLDPEQASRLLESITLTKENNRE